MPLTISLAHRLTRRLADARKSGELSWLRPDGKSQVTVEYDDDWRPLRAEALVISTQHAPDVDNEVIGTDVREHIIDTIVEKSLVDDDTKIYVNPSGRFVVGGPKGDAGLTGRKIIVDTYGGVARHGGGAFSGKDPTKVDRSGAYAARWVAKTIVAAGLARRCEVTLSYAIGVAQPTSLGVETFATGEVPDSAILSAVRKHFDLRPGAIIRDLDLRRPIYRATAVYGHFGRTSLQRPLGGHRTGYGPRGHGPGGVASGANGRDHPRWGAGHAASPAHPDTPQEPRPGRQSARYRAPAQLARGLRN